MPIEEKKMEIKVLGPGCKKCHETEKIVKAAVAEASVDATVEYVSDIKEIARYGVFVTPAVVVNGGVKSVGKVPKKDDVLAWLTGK
jgi:small redox-active disulfide protein 2